ncbi:MAG: hypothetical protein EXS05_01520 [Planctomycetaceae bacterium]|nr:hypothetical protein [Planctomycetaceae bacterium]
MITNRIRGWLARRPTREKSGRGVTPARSRAVDALHVFVLVSFAVAQPTYDRLGERASFMIDSGITLQTVLVWIGLVSLALPAMIVLIQRAVAFLSGACWGPRTYEALHAVVVFGLLTLIAACGWTRVSFLPGFFILGLAFATATAATLVYFKWRRVRSAVTLMAIGIVVFPITLIFHSSFSGMVFPPEFVRIHERPQVPVVLLVLDEICGASLMTPDRQIDGGRFPNFARLAEGATWFRNATTVHDETWQAVPAILSGKHQTTGGPPVPVDLPLNLFSLLVSGALYDVAAFEPVSNLAQDRRNRSLIGPKLWEQTRLLTDALARAYLFDALPLEYHRHLPRLPKLWFGLRDSVQVDRAQHRGVIRYGWSDNRTQQFEHFLECIDETKAPTLYFIHAVVPHVPWVYLPSGRRYTADADIWNLTTFNSHDNLFEFWGQDDLLVAQCEQRYLMQLEYVDRLIGDLISRLKKTGQYDGCLLIVAGDHGVSFRTGQPRRATSPENLSDILSVPLFVKRPFQTVGATSDRPVESIDILPTIVDVLGIKLSSETEGWSVFDTSRADREQKTIYHGTVKTVVDPAAIVNSDVPSRIRERFGDASDPDRFFGIGPISELVGRRVDSLEVGDEPGVEIELHSQDDVSGQPLVKCYFQGSVRSPKVTDRPVILAVAVNGIIGAVTRTYLLEGIRDRWAAMVPETLLTSDANEIRFYSVDGDEKAWRLSPCVMRPLVK